MTRPRFRSKHGNQSIGKALGIDVGLTHFAITSDCSKYDHPKFLKLK